MKNKMEYVFPEETGDSLHCYLLEGKQYFYYGTKKQALKIQIEKIQDILKDLKKELKNIDK